MTEKRSDRSYAQEAVDLIGEAGSGVIAHELGLRIAEVAAAIRSAGRGSGKVVLTLSFKAATKGSGGALAIAGDVKSTVPKPETSETIMFATNDGRLSRRHPDQPALPFDD